MRSVERPTRHSENSEKYNHSKHFIDTMRDRVGNRKTIFVAALKGNACAVTLAHNHPSGNLNPSQADIKLTKDMVAAGKFLHIPVLDHVMMTNETYYSFADQGLL